MVHLVAYEFRNDPVYEGGPVSIGPNPGTDVYIPTVPIQAEPYPPGYIPNIPQPYQAVIVEPDIPQDPIDLSPWGDG